VSPKPSDVDLIRAPDAPVRIGRFKKWAAGPDNHVGLGLVRWAICGEPADNIVTSLTHGNANRKGVLVTYRG